MKFQGIYSKHLFWCLLFLLVTIHSGFTQEKEEELSEWDLGLEESESSLLDVLLSEPTEESEVEDDDLEWDPSLEETDDLDVMSILEEAILDAQGEGFFDLKESSLILGTQVGRRSNVLFASDLLAEDRALYGMDAEFMFWGFNYDGHRLTFYNYFEHLGYLGEGQADKEQIAISSFNYELPVYEDHKAYLDVGYLYQDQVFDVSSSEADLFTLKAAGHRFSVGTGWKKKFGENWTAQAGIWGERQLFIEPLDDYWQFGPTARIEWNPKDRQRIRLRARYENRDYDTRNEVITGTPLRFKRFETELEWKYDLDSIGNWWTRLDLGYRRNEDNGGGFFDYHRYAVEPSIGYTDEIWDLELGYTWRKYMYDMQFFGIDQIERRDSILFLRFAYRIDKNWTWFTEWESQIATSTDPSDEYDVFSFMTGFDFELTW